MHGQPVEALTAYFILDPAWDNCRHDSKVYPVCLQDISLDFNELPFASLSEESFNSTVRMDPPYHRDPFKFV